MLRLRNLDNKKNVLSLYGNGKYRYTRSLLAEGSYLN